MILQILFFIVFLLVASMAYASWRGAPWVPTKTRDVVRMAKLANLQSADRFVELGCGTGNVSRYLASHSSAKIFGVELSLVQWFAARVLARDLSNSPTFILADAFHHDLSSYNVVYLFLMPDTYKKISPKLKAELKPGSRVISYVWPIADWTATTVDHIEGSPDLFLYTI